jgi:hypothetical protein
MTEQAGVADKHFVGDGIQSECVRAVVSGYFVERSVRVWTILLNYI